MPGYIGSVMVNQLLERGEQVVVLDDTSRLVADASNAREVLSWRTQYQELETIIRTTWDWHLSHPEGYGAE